MNTQPLKQDVSQKGYKLIAGIKFNRLKKVVSVNI
jgi:hypothetical protein